MKCIQISLLPRTKAPQLHSTNPLFVNATRPLRKNQIRNENKLRRMCFQSLSAITLLVNEYQMRFDLKLIN